MYRRSFLYALGLGGAAVAALPVEELIDRLAFARSPTTSIYLSPDVVDQLMDASRKMLRLWCYDRERGVLIDRLGPEIVTFKNDGSFFGQQALLAAWTKRRIDSTAGSW